MGESSSLWEVIDAGGSDGTPGASLRDGSGSILCEVSLAPGELRAGNLIRRVAVTAGTFPGGEPGQALIRWAEGVVRAEPVPGCATTLRIDLVDAGSEVTTCLAEGGFNLNAEDEMVMRLDRLPRERLQESLSVRQWDEEWAPFFFRAYDASFRDRPGFPGWTESEWRSVFAEHPDLRPERSLVVLEGTEPVAFAVCWVEGDEPWIEQLGVRPEWRGTGIVEGLVTEVCERFHRDGYATVTLSVNVNNPRARRVWERIGFELVRQHQSHTKKLT